MAKECPPGIFSISAVQKSNGERESPGIFAISAVQKNNAERESPWNIPHLIWMGCDCIVFCFVLNVDLCSISLLIIYKISQFFCSLLIIVLTLY